MLWRRLNVFCLGLVLSLLLSPLSLSADDCAETEEMLDECATRLETTTNELENALDLMREYRSLTQSQRDLIDAQRSTIAERDKRLSQTANSFDDYVSGETARLRTRTIVSASAGIAVGVVTALLLGAVAQ